MTKGFELSSHKWPNGKNCDFKFKLKPCLLIIIILKLKFKFVVAIMILRLNLIKIIKLIIFSIKILNSI